MSTKLLLVLLAGLIINTVSFNMAPKTPESLGKCSSILIQHSIDSIRIMISYSPKHKQRTISIKSICLTLRELKSTLNSSRAPSTIFWMEIRIKTIIWARSSLLRIWSLNRRLKEVESPIITLNNICDIAINHIKFLNGKKRGRKSEIKWQLGLQQKKLQGFDQWRVWKELLRSFLISSRGVSTDIIVPKEGQTRINRSSSW